MSTDQDIDLALRDAETVHVIEAVAGGPVDPPDVSLGVTWSDVTKVAPGDRPPIVPAWLRSKQQRAAHVRRIAGDLGYYLGLHAWNTPKYLVKTAVYAPRGVFRGIGKVLWWASAEDGNWHLRQHAANKNEVHDWLALNRTRSKEAGARWWVVAVIAVPAIIAVLAAWGLGVVPPAGWWAALVVVTMLAARMGRPADRPIIDRVVQGRRFVKLTGEMVRHALVSLSIPGIREAGQVEFPPPGIHRDGPGWLARVNLPAGVEAVKVLERRGALSSALRLPVDQVWPAAGPEHAGQLDLWVGYLPSSQMGQPPWDLADPSARTSVFEPYPFGTDERQRPVSATLFERNFLIGGQPGSGKSYGARTFATIAALDPTCELKIAEFKGVGDYLDMAPLCSTYAVGVDDQAFQVGMDIIDWALAECERRGTRIRKARERGEAPLGKVTPELARKPGSGLHPVFILLDEVHELFGYDKDTAAKAERAIKRGRALGIIICLATQIPDKESLPPNITRCVTVRWCMSVGGQVENDMILGTGAYKRGLSATAYRPGPPPDGDSGWGVMIGLVKPGPVRSFFPDPKTSTAIVARAAALRGGVVGASLDEQRVKMRDMLADARAVLQPGEAGMPWAVLAERLAELAPEAYAGITADMVREALARFNVPSQDVKVGRNNIKGVRRTALDAVLEPPQIEAD